MHLLVVDDDALALDALSTALTDAGHEVEVAHDGREALEIIRKGRCRLVISDWVMPQMNGLELCRRIRSENLPGYVYVILLTSRDGVRNVVEGLSAGADDFITKPFHIEELLLRIHTGDRILSLETRDMAIFAMAKLAESRDPETGAHLERVRNYARILAANLADQGKYPAQIDGDFIRLIYLTSPLHDIGKVGIPDSVLLKPGRLSSREFDIMKTHTTIGAETLGAALRQFPGARFLCMARDVALTHHERFDGTGYPTGLTGEDIPLCGRIVALADVYDALTSKRIYKLAMAHDIARSMILDEAGTHFDPAIVDAFIAEEERFIDVSNNYADGDLVVA